MASNVKALFDSLDDELIIRILDKLGSTICMGTAPARRAALLPSPDPIRAQNHPITYDQAPIMGQEVSMEFDQPLIAEAGTHLLHTPPLSTNADSVAKVLHSSSGGHCGPNRSEVFLNEPTPKPPPPLLSATKTADSATTQAFMHPASVAAVDIEGGYGGALNAGAPGCTSDGRIAIALATQAAEEATNATAIQALACTNRRFRRLVFTHACTACTCTVPTLVHTAANRMGPFKLLHMDLHWCEGLLQDHHLLSLPKATHLRSLNLSHCTSLTGTALLYLHRLDHLTFLNLSYCRDISPSGYCHLPTGLQSLNLSHMNEYRTPLFMHLTRLTGLQSLDLTCNDALITGLSGIEKLSALTWLSVADCDLINDQDRFALSSLLQLQSLDLSGTKISFSTLEFLVPLTNLTYVCLDGCVKIRQMHVAWMREKCDAAAWEHAEVPTDFHTVDPSSLILTADCVTPVATFSRKRASCLLQKSSSGFGAHTGRSSLSTSSHCTVAGTQRDDFSLNRRCD